MKDREARRLKFMRARIVFLTSGVFALAGFVLYEAFVLQVRRAPELREKAEAQYLREISLAPKRGTIYDRDGAELAVSVDVDSVWANPRELRQKADPKQIAKKLAPLLELDAGALAQRLAADRAFVWVKRRVSAAQGQAVRGLKLPGISISEEARRFYPNRELAAHLLGFANVDGRGIEGLELMLEDKLRGSVRSSSAVLDRRGKVVFSEQLLDARAAQGNEVTLTLDKTLQHIAERELELAVRTSEAQSGSVVMVDPERGELLAIANYPTFNPNAPQRASSSERRNRAIADRFEPGSTLKPFTVAAALAGNVISLTDQIDVQGSLQVDEYRIRDTHPSTRLTPGEIIIVSSNIGAAKIGMALGRPGLFRGLSNFGFGETTGSGLPGETGGLLRPYERWYAMDAATIPFGQGMSTTTLQLAYAMGALANGGRLMDPVLIKRVVDPMGQTLEQGTPHIRRQVVPALVARQVSDMMVGVTGEGGTGTEAAIDGYLVAGKTGTAQKADPRGGYSKDKWTSSFAGYAPAQKPRLVIAVILDEPMVSHLGGAVAAPAFRRIMEQSLRHLGVQADHGSTLAEQVRARQAEREQQLVAAVPVKPAPLALSEQSARLIPAGQALVPNLLGRTAREALIVASRSDLTLKLYGSGVVRSQAPLADTLVPRGSALTLTLSARVPDDKPQTASLAPGGAAGREWTGARAQARARVQTLVAVASRGGQDG
jgi:cell division protein FtsI (penicillin-binding protein 3)